MTGEMTVKKPGRKRNGRKAAGTPQWIRLHPLLIFNQVESSSSFTK